MHLLVAIINNFLVFPWPTNRPHCTIHKSKAVGQRCPIASHCISVHVELVSAEELIIPLCDLGVMVIVDPLLKMRHYHADLWHYMAKSVDHIAQTTRVRQLFQDNVQPLNPVSSRSLLTGQTLRQFQGIRKSRNVHFYS